MAALLEVAELDVVAVELLKTDVAVDTLAVEL